MRICCLLIMFLFLHAGWSQEPEGDIFWIQFNTKEGSPWSLDEPGTYLSARALERRERMNIPIDSTDLPVNPAFTDSLKKLGFCIKHTSRWMNGAIGVLDPQIPLFSVFKPSFVDLYEQRSGILLKSRQDKFFVQDSISETNYYGTSFTQVAQMNGHKLHEFSRGEGVHIAIIDGGFYNCDSIAHFNSLFLEGRILGTFDFVKPGNDVYSESTHGTMVLSTIAADIEEEMIGTAPDASFWLLRSEDVYDEYPAEEDYWIAAVEFADSAGCDVINTSLGYTTFDNPDFDHTYDEFNGETIRMARVANLAAGKGMVLVCSAGNSGDDPWYYISAPSESKNVLSVAAVNSEQIVTGFSSRGFGQPARPPKPDLAAMGSGVTVIDGYGNLTQKGGTSFSSPLIAGMAACLVNLYPNLSALEIMDIIRKGGHLYPEHNVEYGYGIPDFYRIYTENQVIDGVKLNEKNVPRVYPNPFETSICVTNAERFHRLDCFSIAGQKLFSLPLTGNKHYPVPPDKIQEMAPGFYLMVFRGDRETIVQKLIKR